MIREAIDKILELAQKEILEIGGLPYRTVQANLITPPRPNPLMCHTLTGVLEWIGSEDYRDCMIHIHDADHVELISDLSDDYKDREGYLFAQPFKIRSFEYGTFMSLERFMIELQTRFVDSAAKGNLMNYLASIKGEIVTQSKDDGIAQEVSIENKIGRLDKVKVDPMVRLAPFRTFNEIKQPESPFLFRLRSGESGTLPTAALFEADGGQWRNVAINSIAEFFKKNKLIKTKNLTIIN
jgi:hypothetical protein